MTRPFTQRTLAAFRSTLADATISSKRPSPIDKNASVLIPFCNVAGIPGVLLEVRGKAMRTHSGEVR